MSKKVFVTTELLHKARNIFLNEKLVYTTDGRVTRSELRALRHKGYLESRVSGGVQANGLLTWFPTKKLMEGL
jgi:hypothetical protein